MEFLSHRRAVHQCAACQGLSPTPLTQPVSHSNHLHHTHTTQVTELNTVGKVWLYMLKGDGGGTFPTQNRNTYANKSDTAVHEIFVPSVNSTGSWYIGCFGSPYLGFSEPQAEYSVIGISCFACLVSLSSNYSVPYPLPPPQKKLLLDATITNAVTAVCKTLTAVGVPMILWIPHKDSVHRVLPKNPSTTRLKNYSFPLPLFLLLTMG